MTDDDPLDLAQVAADAQAVEALRAGRRSTDVPGDPALAALHHLLRDVGTDLPEAGAQTPELGSSVLPLSGEGSHRRRVLRPGTAAALVAAGVLSFGGVAAASTVAPVGSPLHDLGQAVRAAAGAVVTAITPPDTAPSPQAGPSPSSTTTSGPTSAPGAVVAAAARSAAAARQVAAHLDAARAHLDAGRSAPAAQRLDAAERQLSDVLPADGAAALRERLEALRERLAEAGTPAAPGAEPTDKPGGKRTDKPGGKPADKPGGKPSEKPAGGAADPAGKPAPDRKTASDPEPEQDKPAPAGKGDQPDPRKTAGGGGQGLGQPSKDASAKPRA